MTIIDFEGYRRWIEYERVWAYSCYYRYYFNYNKHTSGTSNNLIFNQIKRK